MCRFDRICSLASLVLASIISFTDASAVVVNVDFSDPPGTGFNDTNLDRQAERRAALARALEIWEAQLVGSVELQLTASYDATLPPELLATGIYTSASANLSGLPLLAVWYPAPLASQLHGSSLPATSGPDVGFHMRVIFNDTLNGDTPGTGIFYYGLDGNRPSGDVDFVTIALHELGHGFGFGALIDLTTGKWANIITGTVPPPELPFGDVFSMQLTRTPPGGGANDKDFFDMTDTERLNAVTSDEVYWKGTAVKSAAEFTPPPAMSTRLVNSKGEILMFSPATFSSSAISHWDQDHVNDVLLKPAVISVNKDIDVTREAMIDIGWSVTAPPVSGAVAWVDFFFPGEAYGTEALPFDTLGEASSFLIPGGTVNIKTGATSEKPTVNKAMTIHAIGGPVTFGLP